jgi:SSS family solute:Na+ symporter
MGVPFILLSVVLGVAAALVVPGHSHGLIAVPTYIATVMPAPVAAVFVLGIWAAALGWGGPSQFSGATSLGRDVGKAINPAATQADLVRYTRWSLVLLTAVMIMFGFARTEHSAWWNVLAWTLRNGATMAPVLGALFWPLATRRSVYASLSLGFLSGLAWYHLGGWLPDTFLFGIHPVWIGMSVNVTTMVVVTLVQTRGSWRVGAEDPTRQRWGLVALTGAGVLTVTAVTGWSWLQSGGLLGLAVLSAILLAALSTFLLVQQRHEATLTPPATEPATLVSV